MPIHDWTRVQAGLFHDFHQTWAVEIKRVLNRGLMPKGFYAIVEQKLNGLVPDVLAVELNNFGVTNTSSGGTATLEVPKTSVRKHLTSDVVDYAQKANQISIRNKLGQIVAIIEIVSPGNKSSRHSIREFVHKAVEFLKCGIHILIVDIFPPNVRNPQGIHKAIWDELVDEEFELPAEKKLTLVSYQASDDGLTAHIEPMRIGDTLSAMPLFLTWKEHILVPLETTYSAAFMDSPEPVREAIENL
jgi:hypothetical protein